jgi:hypothetical protein
MTYIPEKAKQIALARLDLVHKWLEFRRKSNIKIQADYDFVKLHNTTESHLREVLGKVSRGSLHRWNAMLSGSEDYEKLLPQYRYSKIDEFRTTLTDEEIKIFMSLLLHSNRISIGKATALAVFTSSEVENKDIILKSVSEIFMKDYAENFCKPNTIKTYTAILRTNVIPILGNKKVREICTEDIRRFYTICKRCGMGERRLKNSLALLNQILKYCKREKLAKTDCEFQVRRLTDKNKFSINRIIFEENL